MSLGRFRGGVTRERSGLILFLAIAFVLAWTSQIIIYLVWGTYFGPEPLRIFLVTLVGISPALGAVIVTLASGRSLRTLGITRGQGRVYLICWLLPFLIWFTGAMLWTAFGGGFEFSQAQLSRHFQGDLPFYATSLPVYVIYMLAVSTILGSFFAFFEELGWRGFLLPTLEARWGRRIALPLHGAIWGLWHVPLALLFGWIVPGHPFFSAFFGYIVGLTLLGTLMGRLFFLSGSVFTVSLFHGAYNTGQDIIATLSLDELDVVFHMMLLAVLLVIVFVPWSLILKRVRARLGEGDAPCNGR